MPSTLKFTRNMGREETSSSTPLTSISNVFREYGERFSLSPAALKFVFLCVLWYLSSALSNNSAKQILIQFKYPVTLTFIQFGFISGWCGLLAMVQQLRGRNSRALFGAKNGIRYPTLEIILTTLPMSFFQIAGHIFGSLATSQIPVSVVHTVKVRLF
jgi:solute carrier family 35, member E1